MALVEISQIRGGINHLRSFPSKFHLRRLRDSTNCHFVYPRLCPLPFIPRVALHRWTATPL
jgi:hypothetical protein